MRLTKFTGLNTLDNPLDVSPTGLQVAKNVDIDRNGRISTRDGYTSSSTAGIVSAWSDNYVFLYIGTDGKLYKLDSPSSSILIGNINGKTLKGQTIAGVQYLSTDKQSYVLTGLNLRSAGVEKPSYIEIIEAQGNLKAGRYLITATSVDDDGRESGSNSVIPVTLTDDNSGFSITVTTDSPYSNIYISEQNGEELYLYAESLKSVIIKDIVDLSSEPLDREFVLPMPGLINVSEYKSVLYGSFSNYLYFSEPLEYEVYDSETSIIEMDSVITMVHGVEHGLFVSTSDAIFFITGTPESIDNGLNINEVYNHPAILDTDREITMSLVSDGSRGGRGVIFNTMNGICLGTADGTVRNLTERKIILDSVNQTAFIDGSRYVVTVN